MCICIILFWGNLILPYPPNLFFSAARLVDRLLCNGIDELPLNKGPPLFTEAENRCNFQTAEYRIAKKNWKYLGKKAKENTIFSPSKLPIPGRC